MLYLLDIIRNSGEVFSFSKWAAIFMLEWLIMILWLITNMTSKIMLYKPLLSYIFVGKAIIYSLLEKSFLDKIH